MKLAKAHRTLLFVWLFMVVYQTVVVNNFEWFHVNDITYAFYTVDYSMGFCSRILPGAVYAFLNGPYSSKAVSAYLTVLYLAFLFLLSYFIEKFILAFPDSKKACLVLVVLFLTGPFTFEMFSKEFGMLDFHWALFFLVACLFLHNRYLRFFIPVLVAFMIITHYGALVCYVAAILLLLLFCFVNAETKHERTAHLIVFVCSLCVGLGLTAYFVMNDEKNLVYSMEAFDDILVNQRNVLPSSGSFYYDIYFYKHSVDILSKQIPDSLLFSASDNLSLRDLLSSVLHQVKVTFTLDSVNKYLLINLSSFGLLGFLASILFSYFKNSKHLLKRLLTVLFFGLALIVQAVGVFFSTDNTRWLGHSFIILFVIVFYVLFFDYREGMKKLQARLSQVNDWLIATVMFFYANTIVDPYPFYFAFMR